MAFENPNWTQMPNEFFDIILPDKKYGKAEIKSLAFLIRKTIGFHKPEGWDRIPLSQLQKGTGLNRLNLSKALNQLEKDDWIEIKRDSNGNHYRPKLVPKRYQPSTETTLAASTETAPSKDKDLKQIINKTLAPLAQSLSLTTKKEANNPSARCVLAFYERWDRDYPDPDHHMRRPEPRDFRAAQNKLRVITEEEFVEGFDWYFDPPEWAWWQDKGTGAFAPTFSNYCGCVRSIVEKAKAINKAGGEKGNER